VHAGERRRGEGVRVRTDREERRVPEVEQAGEADDDVEPERQEHEHAGVREAVQPDRLALEQAEWRDQYGSTKDGHSDEQRHAHDDRGRSVDRSEVRDPCPRPEDARCGRAHARSPICWPRMPAGRKTRTRMRTAKTIASDQRF
jgi:hypothetical protein